MKIETDHNADIVHSKPDQGAYEWWYFDALDATATYGIVVIFYEGNPFSPKYNRIWQNGETAAASNHPAVTISVYHHGEPIYYSFTEFDASDASFSEEPFEMRIGDHRLRRRVEAGRLIYTLLFSEYLPSGDALMGRLEFNSSVPDRDSGDKMGGDKKQDEKDERRSCESHRWILSQPRARVTGSICIYRGLDYREIEFNGTGYHDHNIGYEPMHKEFAQWYWGRLHTDEATLIYYLMDSHGTWQHNAWLLHHGKADEGRIEEADSFELEDAQWSIFGLHSCRRLKLTFAEMEATLRMKSLVDDGPFYQRFISEGIIHSKDMSKLERRAGFAEYIKPNRIQWRVFWPLVRMRLRYGRLASHPVQRSPRLYRWTW